MRLAAFALIVTFPVSAHAEWVLLVEGKVRNTYPDEAMTACSLDRASWKWVHPADKTECRKIKGKAK